MIQVQLSGEALDIQACVNYVSAPEAGGIDVFIGTVRNATKGKQVVRLEFEAYEGMAIKEMQRIAAETMKQFSVFRISIHHRVGILQIGEVPVVIAVSAAHRAAAFEACRYIIDTLKGHVPIWKKEVFEDGAVWVAAHP